MAPARREKKELRSIQGVDARIPVNKLGKVVKYYLKLICGF